MSCVGKLFTAVLNDRVTSFIESLGLLGEEQAGFRSGYSTMDHIFSLHAIFDWYLKRRKRVYTAFVDYKKAFDLIDRSSLWLKLIDNGINGKLLRVVKDIYKKSKSCVSYNNSKSDFFKSNIGVKQGENLSPILFSLYLNDFSSFLSQRYPGLDSLSSAIDVTCFTEEENMFVDLFTLLYADDTIVLAENAEELQLALDALFDYCQLWHLTVNTAKTKIVIFSRGKVRKAPTFLFGGDEICVCDDYVYLGTTFNYNNSFKKAINKQVSQARRALYSMKSKILPLLLPIDVKLELFEHLVMPILLYGSEIWGFEDLAQIETFFCRYCKELLGLHKRTPNCMVYGEIGKNKLAKNVTLRMLMFWYKLVHSKMSKVANVLYNFQYALSVRQENSMSWVIKIKNLLDNLGLTEIWNNQASNLTLASFKSLISAKLNDINKQEWHSDVEENSQCLNYRIFKQTLHFEKYFHHLNDSEAKILCKFRCANHKLPIVSGRYNQIPRNERFCTHCNEGKIGDEFHYLFQCSRFHEQRKKYLKRYYWKNPNTLKMDQLFNCEKKTILFNLTKFCSYIMTHV